MADLETDTRDRVIRLEAQMEHAIATIDKMAGQLTEMHDLLQQARGARWLLVVAAMAIGAAGGFLAKLGTLLTWVPR